MLRLEIFPDVKVSSPNLIGTLTKEFLKKTTFTLLLIITLAIRILIALDPISIAAYFSIFIV